MTYKRTMVPRLTVVTPVFNGADYLEDTIQSVLSQEYPEIEYLIVDGGSDDGTVDVIRRHEKRLTGWVSEPDRGQAHALNKAALRGTGEIFTFVNADDILATGAAERAVRCFRDEPRTGLVRGGFGNIDGNGRIMREKTAVFPCTWQDIALGRTYQPQAGTFWRTRLFRDVGGFREDLHCFFDQEFFIRVLGRARARTLDGVLAYARIHGRAKTRARGRDTAREKHDVILESMGRVRGRTPEKLRAYRSVKLSHTGTEILGEAGSFARRLERVCAEPVLMSSPAFLRKLFSSPGLSWET